MNKRVRNELKVYLSILLHIVIFNVTLTSATIVFHEIGHFSAGSLAGCDNIKVVLLDSHMSTYTQMNCSSTVSGYVLFFSGFMLVIPFAILLFFLKNYEKFYSFVALGFNLIISISDVALFSNFLALPFLILGILSVVIGETLLINRYLLFIERMGVII
jgi:hypothetical protein